MDYPIKIVVLFSFHFRIQLTTNIFKIKNLKIGCIFNNIVTQEMDFTFKTDFSM